MPKPISIFRRTIQKNPVQDYFSNKYPDRSNARSRLFRRDESARLNTVQNWIPHCEGLNVFDFGCGDGVFLSKLIDGAANIIRIEDIVESNVMEAQKRLAHKAEKLEIVVADFPHSINNSLYDVILAIGVFDYHDDWSKLLNALLDLTVDGGMLIVDFPKSRTLHSLLRKYWLALNKVKYNCVNREELGKLINSMKLHSEIVELDLNWMARIIKTSK